MAVTSLPGRGIAILSGLLIFLAACGSSAPDPAPPAYAAALRPQIDAELARDLAPGAAVVVKSPKGNWEQAFGTRNRGGGEPVGIDDQFRVGSVTKTWTGTVILQLVQEGKLKLSDPISAYVPDVPNGDRITIAQLLSMRSGLYNYSLDPEFNRSLDTHPERVFRTDELLAISYANSPLFNPGEQYDYSNTNTVLLGLVIERITHKSAASEFRDRLFAPFGLGKTFMPAQQDTRLPAPFARGYQYGSNLQALEEDPTPDLQAAPLDRSLLRDVTDENAGWAWTAGMGISTARELAVYAERLVGGGYLDAALQKQRLDSCTPVDPANAAPDAPRYCLGIAQFGSYYGHTGDIPGYNTVMLHDPQTGTTIIVWTSRSAGPGTLSPAVNIAKLIIAALN
jgi:D-alanyl-D-alanine carboxypeptidase